MADTGDDEKFNWIVQFRKSDPKLYTYMNRTQAEMIQKLEQSYAKNGYYPYAMGVQVGNRFETVEVTPSVRRTEVEA